MPKGVWNLLGDTGGKRRIWGLHKNYYGMFREVSTGGKIERSKWKREEQAKENKGERE